MKFGSIVSSVLNGTWNCTCACLRIHRSCIPPGMTPMRSVEWEFSIVRSCVCKFKETTHIFTREIGLFTLCNERIDSFSWWTFGILIWPSRRGRTAKPQNHMLVGLCSLFALYAFCVFVILHLGGAGFGMDLWLPQQVEALEAFISKISKLKVIGYIGLMKTVL